MKLMPEEEELPPEEAPCQWNKFLTFNRNVCYNISMIDLKTR